jgi:hypothetical protein
MTKGKKRILILGIALFCLVILYTIGRAIFFGHVQNLLEDQLYGLRDSGYIVNYDSINVDWKKGSITVYRLNVKRDLDSALCSQDDFIAADMIRAEGFRLTPLLLNKRLSFEAIIFDSSQIVLHQSFFKKANAEKRDRREFSIRIDELKLPSLHLTYYDSMDCKPHAVLRSNFAVTDFELAFHSDKPAHYELSSFHADSTAFHLFKKLYSLHIKETKLDLDLGNFDLDTLKIIPHYNEVTFGRKNGFETDRIEGLVPYINAYGLQIDREDTLGIRIRKLTTQLFLKLFRDKRLPEKKIRKPLPIELINSLSFGLKIDSIMVNKSFVEYRERAIEADSAGMVYFDNLYATIRNVDNTTGRDPKGRTVMIAEADFLGQGDLHVEAVLPWQENEKQKVKGVLSNLDMRRLNTMIEPQIRMRAESGKLNALHFHFNYDDRHSIGELELNYNDLRVITFQSTERVMKKL